ncbi:uncharacterized protein LOC143862664 [Tasmannia lanceolata]|uniref:uncharacterized protein LOC143862664 n=1 Tax=Tasmannia lanceolata TaxID=3420 RepID=UPI0040634976
MSTELNHVGAVGKHKIDSEAKEPKNSKKSGKSGSVGKIDLESNESEISKRGGKSGAEGSLFRRQRTPSLDALWIKQPILLPQMSTKVKGLLKGLRYISQIFEPNYKEQEMQIGYPTDVKHVAHIGWDGPSVNPPSWMNEFKTTTGISSATLNMMGEGKEKPPELPDMPKTRTSRRHQSSSADPPIDSPTRPRTSRRDQSSGDPPIESPTREHLDMPTRRHHHLGHHRLGHGGTDSPKKGGTDSPGLPKHSRRKKKGSGSSSGGGSSRSSRSKALASNFSDPDVKSNEQNQPLKTVEEGI